MRRYTTAPIAAALLAALSLSACSSDTDQADDTETPDQEQTDDTSTDDPGDDEEPAGDETPAVDGDLALGETYTWDDGLSLTIDNLVEVPASEFTEFDYVPEGEMAWTADLTIVNSSDQPFDLSDLSLTAAGATAGGEVTPIVLDGRTELLEGRLAAGETKDTAMAWSLAVDTVGRDVLIETYRFSDDVDSLDPLVWTGTIG